MGEIETNRDFEESEKKRGKANTWKYDFGE